MIRFSLSLQDWTRLNKLLKQLHSNKIFYFANEALLTQQEDKSAKEADFKADVKINLSQTLQR